MKRVKIICCSVGTLFMLLVLPSIIANAAGTTYYAGSVSKYSDFESAYKRKTNRSESATNMVTDKPAGSFVSWLEVNTGSNCSQKVSYTSNGIYYMKYDQNFTNKGTCAEVLYVEKYDLKLNISTTLTNFTSGGVKGYWSPDKV